MLREFKESVAKAKKSHAMLLGPSEWTEHGLDRHGEQG